MKIAIKVIMANLSIIAIILALGAWPLARLWVGINIIGAAIMAYLAVTSVE